MTKNFHAFDLLEFLITSNSIQRLAFCTSSSMNWAFQRTMIFAGVFLLLAFAGICGYRIYHLSIEQKAIKQDYSTVNNISFGILSVNKWRDLIVRAVSRRIEHFRLSPAEKDSLQKEIRLILNSLVDKADSMMDAPQKSLGGKLRKLAFHAFVKKDELRSLVDPFAGKITRQLMTPGSRERLKYLAISKLEDLREDTYDSSLLTKQKKVDSIYTKYRVAGNDQFNKVTGSQLQHIKKRAYAYAYIMLGCVLLLLSLWYLLRQRQSIHISLYVLSILMGLTLLATGLTSTMIEIDARISALDFKLIGETISFREQVLFFQSKSIVDVVMILIDTGRIDSILVGVLILCFSIFFPVTKLLSTGIFLLGKKEWTKSKFIEYFAFRSGKWSMADVTVVAIFMAYIGFNGILDSQLDSLNLSSDSVSGIATNHTSLQPGYAVFVAFVLYGLALSHILKKIMKKQAQQ